MPSNADEWREMRGRTASSVAVSGSSAERAQQDALAAEWRAALSVSTISLPTSAESGLAATPQDGDAGETRVKLRHGDALVVRTRAGRAQLDALRRLLGAGFQPHLLHNPLLHQARARDRPGGFFFRRCARSMPRRASGERRAVWRLATSTAFDCCSAWASHALGTERRGQGYVSLPWSRMLLCEIFAGVGPAAQPALKTCSLLPQAWRCRFAPNARPPDWLCVCVAAPRRSPSPHGSSRAAARARTRPAAAHAPDGAPRAPQVFGFEPRAEPGERLTQREKRLFRSPAAAAVKSRQVRRARDRANTAAYKGAMLAGEGW